ncbi:hypothetical protein [Streptomyces sp. MOE7]|uniref:hypothetical protein n=1 Tax=Streptomyces sp. MOE7 TaxID=1961713 RepID=UPI0009FD3CEA|nr:hypothetical protein [Streptomyces sp. MOE7]ARH90494.1 hypothetical protein STRMOE7_09420 [Streptomyces sp. MOE7]
MDHETAWADPDTRRAWRRTALFRCAALPASLLAFPAWLFAVVMTPAWLLVLWLPVLCVGLWYALLAMAALASLAGMRRVLRVYPWQLDLTEVRSKKNGSTQFVVPDPERPEKSVRLGYGGLIGTGRHFWVRTVQSGQVTAAWFAGDPRYLGVVATPGPRHLVLVAQREATDSRMSPRRRGVSPEARARARAAGARVGGG